jgi:hypothetical protein
MATKSSKDKSRYWKMRSGMLSLSILGVLPVIAFMHGGSSSTQSAATAATGQLATISQAASGGSTSAQSQTVSSQSTSSSTKTHTRTAAS